MAYLSAYQQIQERRKKQAQDLAAGLQQGSDQVRGGLFDIDKWEQEQKQRAQADEDRKQQLADAGQRRADADYNRNKAQRADALTALERFVDERIGGGAGDKEINDAARERDDLGLIKDDNEVLAAIAANRAKRAAAPAAAQAAAVKKQRDEQKAAAELEKLKSEAAKNNAAAKKLSMGKGPPSAAAKEAADLKHRLLVAQVAAAEKTASAKESGKPVDTAVANDIAAMKTSIEQIDDIASRAPAIKKGYLANASNYLAQKLNMSDVQVSQFKADVGKRLADYIRSISGATVPKEEVERLVANVPTMNDDDDLFMSKLLSTKKDIEIKLRNVIDAQGNSGRDVSGYRPKPTQADIDAAIAAGDMDKAVELQMRMGGP